MELWMGFHYILNPPRRIGILKIVPKCISENRWEAELMNYFFLYRRHFNSLWLFQTAFSPLNFTTCPPSYFSLNEHSMIEVLIIHISSYKIQVPYQGVLNIVQQYLFVMEILFTSMTYFLQIFRSCGIQLCRANSMWFTLRTLSIWLSCFSSTINLWDNVYKHSTVSDVLFYRKPLFLV